ncbi:hypothetical protein AB9K26_14405 [Psychroserpens sp. XS_ASV72]|uniref:hypothetical protein n=1 Tax=Psychroserpens sp. XS_ASV72 TaxID=3241293 RepID=UPI0035183353
MKRTKYILLFIGIVGIAASVFGWVKDQSFANHLIGFVCGASLIYGYFEIDKAEKGSN